MTVIQFKKPLTVNNKNNGFAMNSRDILKTAWYSNINARLIYLELSLRVTHSNHQTVFNGNKVSLKPGQYVTTLENLAKSINGTKEQARNALNILEKQGVISKATVGKQRNKCSIITLKSNTLNNTLSTHYEPVVVRAVSEVAHTTHTRVNTVKQEESKQYKDTYVSLVSEVVQLFNETFDDLSAVRKMTPTRKNRLLKIIKDKFYDPNGKPISFKTIDDWKTFFAYMQESDFLMGRSGEWQCSFDWIVNSTNFLKVLEGNYENK